MTKDVNDIINDAKNKSEEQRAVAVQSETTTAVQVHKEPRKMGLEDLGSEGLLVDTFLRMGDDGFKIKDTKGYFEEMIVDIDMGEDQIAIFEGARYGGEDVVYIKTFDGVNEAKGNDWQAELDKANASGTAVKVYKGADITMTVVEDIKNTGGEVLVEAGKKVGYSTPPSAKANLTKLYKQINAEGLDETVVRVKLTPQHREYKTSAWIIPEFELMGESPEAV